MIKTAAATVTRHRVRDGPDIVSMSVVARTHDSHISSLEQGRQVNKYIYNINVFLHNFCQHTHKHHETTLK